MQVVRVIFIITLKFKVTGKLNPLYHCMFHGSIHITIKDMIYCMNGFCTAFYLQN
jgi:hypothetical protein